VKRGIAGIAVSGQMSAVVFGTVALALAVAVTGSHSAGSSHRSAMDVGWNTATTSDVGWNATPAMDVGWN
jgi:hypothetical protein